MGDDGIGGSWNAMGSRIMHLIIADRIADCLQIEDRVPFLIGGIAPDAASAKDESHFLRASIIILQGTLIMGASYKNTAHRQRVCIYWAIIHI